MLTRARLHSVTILTILFLAAGASPTSAEAPFEKGWQLRFGGVGVDSGFDLFIVDVAGVRHRLTNASGGVAVSGEYRFMPRLGAELGATAAGEVGHHLDPPFATNNLGFTSISVGLNVHLTPRSKVDVYAGPLLAHLSYGDLTYRIPSGNPGVPPRGLLPGTPVHISVGDEIVFGAAVGLDVPLGKRWSFCTAVKYLYANLDGIDSQNDRTETDFNPIIIGLGVGYRF